MGPFGALNPHAIWIIVILVMAIGALGHIAVRLADEVTGFLDACRFVATLNPSKSRWSDK